ncbi:MAG: methyltransferase [Pseudoalteromonas sp.]
MTLAEQFTALDTLLFNTRRYWQCTAFDFDHFPWPELSVAVDSLSDVQVAELDSNQAALYDFFDPYIPVLKQLPALCHLESEKAARITYPFWISNGIKGRKLEQLQDFTSALNSNDTPVLEWCAGKGHLGRMLAFNGAAHVHSIELQQTLCEQGQKSAKQQGLAMQFSQADVLSDPVSDFFKPQLHAVALHACGALHQRFMEHASNAGTKQISLSPCCYHLFTPNHYQALSVQAKNNVLALTHRDLKLALQETVTAPTRVAKMRNIEVEWRLGFDALRKSVTGSQGYVSVPSVSKAIFSDSFKAFCTWAAGEKKLEIPHGIDYSEFLLKGQMRRKITDRVELVRHVFRRAIEIWLVLDRALYLQERGYKVTVKTFCEKQLTPRNILIQASLTSQTA